MSMSKLLSRSILFLPALLLTSVLTGGAEEPANPVAPKRLQGGKVISTFVAKALFDNREAEFIDTRSAGSFAQAHIPGARTLPYQETSECAVDFDRSVDRFNLVQLPPNKGKTVVFYCDGPNGWTSYKAAVMAIEAGYRDVMWFREGFSGWQIARYPVE